MEHFATTRWSVVAAAGRGDTPSARDALEQLCGSYWYPLYAFVRRRSTAPDDALDLTQGFFARLLEKRDLSRADRGRGRFRSFLLAALKHYLANQRDRERAEKRGGGAPVLSLDAASAEGRFQSEPADERTPEASFERTWALVVLERALDRVRDEYRRAGRGALFGALEARLIDAPGGRPYAELAAELDLTEGAFKVAVHRARRRFREELRREIAETLADPADVDDELRDLFEALGA